MDDSKLKEIYEAGERLCSLAKELGYSPESSSEEESSEEEMPPSSKLISNAGKGVSDLAYSFMKK